MLKLQNIKKDYILSGGQTVEALRGVDLRFRRSEFVSVLGPSGCGKTTLLNIIGGLDRPTSGVLYINGRSTEKYGGRDWDTYRNHSVGFVFQTYNLIPHMSVLANVELAPVISGMPKAERRKRASEALQRVGLGDQLHKKPNQLSGGQMQRVAIARALVNDPEILLADEPTGALDTKTSVQIMDLLREVAKDRLVIMVTHNGELAKEYSTRIVKLKDGLVVDDSDPYEGETEKTAESAGSAPGKKASMSFFTALSLSARNLLTKKTRTILTSIAGSIGIIGIAAILAMSSGMQAYIDRVQEDTLSSYPLYMIRETADTTSIVTAMQQARSGDGSEYDPAYIYPDDRLVDLFKAVSSTKTNDLPSFKNYYEEHKSELEGKLSAISYAYDLNVEIYATLPDGSVMQSNPSTIFDYMGPALKGYSSMMALSGGGNFYSEILEGIKGEMINPVVTTQYDLLSGRWPEAANELVLMLDENNRISNVSLYALGIKDPNELEARIEAAQRADGGEESGENEVPIKVSDLLGRTFTLVMNADYYVKSDRVYQANGKEYPVWTDVRDDVNFDPEAFLTEHGKTLTIVGILKSNPEATSYSIGTPIGYTAALTREIVAYNNEAEISVQQNETPEHDVFSGLTFESSAFTPDRAGEFLALLPAERKSELAAALQATVPSTFTLETLPELLEKTDDRTFELIVKTYAPQDPGPTYTKEQSAEFVASLSDEQVSRLSAMMAMYGSAGLTRETLPAALEALPDDRFEQTVSMMISAGGEAAYTKDEIPQFLEAIGEEGQNKLLEQIKSAFTVKEEDLEGYLSAMPAEQFSRFVTYYLGDASTLRGNLSRLGFRTDEQISRISLYASDFKAKDEIKRFVARYNAYAKEQAENGGKNAPGEVELTDMIGTLLSGINAVINAISVVLVIFVSISLVVSSIMIAIITYISVLERIKEIGILRSLGASKKNISDVFIAETLIEGLISGLFGVGFTLLLCLIANPILHRATGINAINAFLPPIAGVILVAISVLLTVGAGVIPAIIAAHKDPVIALRSE